MLHEIVTLNQCMGCMIRHQQNPCECIIHLGPQISNRESISNINPTNVKRFGAFIFFCNVMKKICTFKVYYLSFNLADLYWPKEQSAPIRYLGWAMRYQVS